MLLVQIKREDRATRIGDGRLGCEHRFARLIAKTGTGIDTPGRVLVTVDREFHRARDAPLPVLVVEDRFQRRFRRIDVCRGFGNLDLRDLVGCVRRSCFHFEFR